MYFRWENKYILTVFWEENEVFISLHLYGKQMLLQIKKNIFVFLNQYGKLFSLFFWSFQNIISRTLEALDS